MGCIDSRAARQTISRLVERTTSRVAYYLDLDNASDSGQFVLGQPLNAVNRRKAGRLRMVSELLPEIIEAAFDPTDGPSCSAIEALNAQHPFLNATIANHSLALLERLFRHGAIDYHGAFVSLSGPRVQPIAVDPIVWRALRRRELRQTKAKPLTATAES